MGRRVAWREINVSALMGENSSGIQSLPEFFQKKNI
jgi:hypothetical protein